MLFHVSEEPDITCFEPRQSATFTEPVVWAVGAEHLRNYLLPRDCPRVTYYAAETTTAADRATFLGDATAVVAVEAAWIPRIEATTLYCYEFSPDTFTSLDPGAGYFVSRTPVHPVSVKPVTDLLAALATHEATVRAVPNLWQLHDAVAASSLQFSMIRMRNAAPRVP